MAIRYVLLRKFQQYIPPIIFLIVILILWEYLVGYLHVLPRYLIATPTTIVRTMLFSYAPQYWLHHIGVTLIECLLGFAVGTLVGLVIAVLVTYSKLVKQVIFPYVIISQVIPKVAIAPLIILWFGFGVYPKIVISAMMSFFPVVVAVSTGLVEISPLYINLARSLRATRWQIFTKLRLPNSLSFTFTGLKLAIMSSFIGAIVGEFVSASEGLGYVVIMSETSLNAPAMFVALTFLAIFGIIFMQVMELVSKIAMPWKTEV